MNYSGNRALLALVGLFITLSSNTYAQSDTAYRLLEPSENFELKFSLLNRIEFLDGQFRRSNNGSSDQLFTSRFLMDGQYRNDFFKLNFEIADTRQALADDGSPVNSRTVGALDLQQLYATWRWDDVIAGSDDIELRLGRQTLNLEARRLMSRTISVEPNSFTGVSADLLRENGDRWKAFHFAQVIRFPNNRADIIDNKIQWNEESKGARISGLFATLPNVFPDLRSEFYVFHLVEKDTGDEQYADLALTTFGTRIYKPAQVRQFDFEVQTAWQVGESRATSSSSDTRDLDHRAAFYHVEAGYTFDSPLEPRAQILYDYASGDDDPFDSENNRFDTLFGARRADFGQTSIYGPFWRTNVSTVGARVALTFNENLSLTATLRDFDLASNRDSWGGTGWRDPTGNSGTELGQQLETRLRWNAIPGNLAVDSGFTWLSAGEFAETVSVGQTPSMTHYAYLQTQLSF